MENCNAYCDESGNTGSNLLDAKQPVLVVGGWVVLDSVIESASEVVKEYIRFQKPHSGELHGVELLKNEVGTRCILNLIHDLCKLNCLPVCQIAEKRYRLAGHVIEVFMAPESNPYIPDSFDFTNEGKPELADKVYNLPDEVLAEFADAYETLDRSLLLDSLRHISTALSLRLETKLADLMLGSLPNIDIIVDEISAGRARFPPNTLTAPNLAAFHMFYQYLEELGRMGIIDKISIIHDESRQFSTSFRMIFETFRDSRNTVIRTAPWSNVYFGFNSVKDLRFADSKDEPLLQAADTLISAVYRYAVNVYNRRQSPAPLMDIARLLFPEPCYYPTIKRIITSSKYGDQLFDL